ncbi:hypothetical protein FRC12_011014 [Ceratobasidium sp. 428]|nr:hypothetical protein FRC12_011014 [Ceratobasidium sp. 428]
MSETYTVIIHGGPFVLTRDQIEFDSPNYFTSCFLGEFTEARTRTLTLSRDPELFRIILDHLSGYEVLPLHQSVIPKRMSPEVALRNLLVDAQFYLLDGLVRAIRQIGSSAQSSSPFLAASPPLSYVVVTAQNFNRWGLPMPISEDTAKSMREKHGLSRCSRITDRSGIETALQNASMRKPFVIEATWTEEFGDPARYLDTYYYLVLRLTG